MDKRKEHEREVEEAPRAAGERQRRALEMEAERYRRVFHGSPIGMVRESTRGVVLEVNRAFLSLLGREDAAEVVDRPVGDLYADPEDAERSRGQLLREGVCESHEIRLHHGQGDVVWAQESSVLVPTETAGTEILRTFLDIDERRERERGLEKLAYRDPLTGLANRRMLGIRADQTLALADRRGIRVGVVYLDLVEFKEVNDAHGHGTGDELLVHVGRCIQNALRTADTVARVGGDEFAVLLSEVDNRGAAVRTTERLLEAIATTHVGEECEVTVRARAGVAVFPDDGHDFETLLAMADTALIRAKGGRVEVVLAEPGS